MSEVVVPEGWEIKQVSSLCKILDNLRIPLNDEERQNMKGHIPYYGANTIVDYINDHIFDEDLILLAEDGGNFDEYEKKPIAFKISGKSWINNHAHVLKPNNNVEFDYLFYSLEHKNITSYIRGGTRSKLNQSDLKTVEVLIPKEKKEQEKIAKILSTLDKNIENTNKIIEKEKNIKKALMQELLTNGIDKDGHIRTRATHAYKESELGLIPDEWEVVSLKEIAKVGSSKRIFEHEYVSEGVPFYRSTEIILKAHNKSVKSEIHISKDKFEEIEASYNVPQKDDILISAVGTIGVPYLVKNEQFYFKDGNLLWIQNIKINPNYLYLFVKSERFQDEINLIAGGSSQSALTIEKLSLLKVLYPKSIDEQKQIAKILTTQDKKIETEETILAKLKELKKGLMNDLLSGKVRVEL